MVTESFREITAQLLVTRFSVLTHSTGQHDANSLNQYSQRSDINRLLINCRKKISTFAVVYCKFTLTPVDIITKANSPLAGTLFTLFWVIFVCSTNWAFMNENLPEFDRSINFYFSSGKSVRSLRLHYALLTWRGVTSPSKHRVMLH